MPTNTPVLGEVFLPEPHHLEITAEPLALAHYGPQTAAHQEIAGLQFEQGFFVARPVKLTDFAEVIAYQRLRYDYFVLEKGWVPADPQSPQQETDHYDAYAQHLAVFKDGQMVAYLRVLPWQEEIGFMLDHEFSALLSTESQRTFVRHGAAELSRLVPPFFPATASSHEVKIVLELLLKLLYHVCREHNITCYYIVVEPSWLKPFARRFGLAFEPIGIPYTFPDGTQAVAAYASLADFEKAVEQHSAEKFRWYRQAF